MHRSPLSWAFYSSSPWDAEVRTSPTASTENPAANTGSFDTPPANQARPAPANDNDAIAAAIRAHLAGNSSINMAAMEMTVTQVNITGNQAQADAEFHLKQGGTSMQMTLFSPAPRERLDCLAQPTLGRPIRSSPNGQDALRARRRAGAPKDRRLLSNGAAERREFERPRSASA